MIFTLWVEHSKKLSEKFGKRVEKANTPQGNRIDMIAYYRRHERWKKPMRGYSKR